MANQQYEIDIPLFLSIKQGLRVISSVNDIKIIIISIVIIITF